MGKIFTARLTAAAVINLPKPGMTLEKIRVFGGATPGTLGILFDGQANAHFPTPSNGTRGFEDYPVNWGPLGSTLQAAIFTFNGGISVAELQFSDAPTPGPSIEEYRGVRFARTDGGAVNAAITVSFDKAPGKPSAILALCSASASRFQFPSIGGGQEQVESAIVERIPDLMEAPHLPETNSLTLQAISDAAQTLQAVVYY